MIKEKNLPLVTILVPNYKTLALTRLCLNLIKQYTAPHLAKVIVIDNDSQDESLDYLRTLDWITLLERPSIPQEGAISAHSRALDLGLAHADTPYVLSIHTDTFVKHPQWLEFLLAEIEKSPRIAGVGSWKLEAKPWWRRVLKKIERKVQLAFYKVTGKHNHVIQGVGKNYYYLRSHCALYRKDLLEQYQLKFSAGDMVAGKYLHKKLCEYGYEMVFLKSNTLIRYLEHINHATSALNPELSTRSKSIRKGRSRIQKSFVRFNAYLNR